MKIIQSFWTGNKNSLTDSYGWLLPIFNYLSWIISCNQLRRYFFQAEDGIRDLLE